MIILPDDILFGISESQKSDTNILSDNLSTIQEDKPNFLIRKNKVNNFRLLGRYTQLYFRNLYRFLFNTFFLEFDRINQFLIPYVPKELQEPFMEIIDTRGYEEVHNKLKEAAESPLWKLVKKVYSAIKLLFDIKRWYSRIKWLVSLFKNFYKTYRRTGQISLIGGGAIGAILMAGENGPNYKNLSITEKLKLKINAAAESILVPPPDGSIVRDFITEWMGIPLDTAMEYSAVFGEGYKNAEESRENKYIFSLSLGNIDTEKELNGSNWLNSMLNVKTSMKHEINRLNVEINVNNSIISLEQNNFQNKVDLSFSAGIIGGIKAVINKAKSNIPENEQIKKGIADIDTVMADIRNAALADAGNIRMVYNNNKIRLGSAAAKIISMLNASRNVKWRIYAKLYETYIHSRNWLSNMDIFNEAVGNEATKTINKIQDSLKSFLDKNLDVYKPENIKSLLYNNYKIKLGREGGREVKDLKKSKDKIKPVPERTADLKIDKISELVSEALKKDKEIGKISLWLKLGYDYSRNTTINYNTETETIKRGDVPMLNVNKGPKPIKDVSIAELLEKSNEYYSKQAYKKEHGFSFFTRTSTMQNAIDYKPADISNYDNQKLFKFDERMKDYNVLHKEKVRQMHIKNRLFYEIYNRIVWIKDSVPII